MGDKDALNLESLGLGDVMRCWIEYGEFSGEIASHSRRFKRDGAKVSLWFRLLLLRLVQVTVMTLRLISMARWLMWMLGCMMELLRKKYTNIIAVLDIMCAKKVLFLIAISTAINAGMVTGTSNELLCDLCSWFCIHSCLSVANLGCSTNRF